MDEQLENTFSLIDAPSLPDVPEPLSESSGDPTDTVDTVIQLQSEDDLVHGRFAPAGRAQKAGSLIQQDEVVRILNLPPIERTPEDIMILAETISRTSFAAGMQRSLLETVAKKIRLVSCQKGSTVMREGGAGDHMYIIATGSCIVIKSDKRGRKRALRSLTVGQSFGELALREPGGRRAATVNAAEDCDLLALNGFEYRHMLAEHDKRELDRRVEMLMRLPVFKGLSSRVIQDVAQLMERRTYRVGSFIFQQGDEAECLYVLVSGAVRIVRQMTVPITFAQHHSTDPNTLHLLDPSRGTEHRYQPIPEKAIRNGRPRSYLLPKPKDQGSHVNLGNQLPSRPQSAAAGCPGVSASQIRPRSSPRLRAALKALRQVKRPPSTTPIHSGYDGEHKKQQELPPPWAVTGRPPWGAGGGFVAEGIENAPMSAAKSTAKIPLQRPKTAQSRFCIVTKGKTKAKDPQARTFENFQDPFEGTQAQTGSRPRSCSALAQHHKPSTLRKSAVGRVSAGDALANDCKAAASTQKKRPSTAHAAFAARQSASSVECSKNAFIRQHLGDLGKSVKPSIQINDPSKVQIPGLEMSGVTAEQLDQSGMLYTDEQPLLESSMQDSGALGAAHGARAHKPPSGRQNMNAWRKRASSLAQQPSSGTGVNDCGPEMCKAWIELTRLEGPDYFGEAAMLSRGVRHATVVADSNVEILVLTKVDFDLKIDRDARDVMCVLVSNYPKDKAILKSMEQEAKWELFKRAVVQQVLVDVGKADRLRWYSSQLFAKAWKP